MNKKKKLKIIIPLLILLVAAFAFEHYKANKAVDSVDETEAEEAVNPIGPTFNADSAYAFTAAQCNFGPRAMNTEGHEKCAEWIIAKFTQYGCKVTTAS